MAHVTATRKHRQELSAANASPARKDQRLKRKPRKNARQVKPRLSIWDTRYTVPGLIQEVDTPSGRRLDLAFCSLPLLVMGDR